VTAAVLATASATARVPAANGASSNAPIGPFQKTVPAVAMIVAKASELRRPMSSPIIPSGTSTPSSGCAGASALKRSAMTRSDGKLDRGPALTRSRRDRLAGELHVLVGAQRVADRVALGP